MFRLDMYLLTSSVTRIWIASASSTMGHTNQHFVGHFDNVSGRNRFHVGNETHSAILCFVRGVVENPLLFGIDLGSTKFENRFGRIGTLPPEAL